jgi:hypothetical protein
MAKNQSKPIKTNHSKKRLQPLQMQAIGMLSMGDKQVVVVERLGVGSATLNRWLKSPAFVAELDKRISESREDSIRQLRTLNIKAVAAIETLLTSPDTSANVLAQVAFKVLDMTAPEIELVDVGQARTLDPERLREVTAAIYGL